MGMEKRCNLFQLLLDHSPIIHLDINKVLLIIVNFRFFYLSMEFVILEEKEEKEKRKRI
jgi:hypothetical protein